MSIKEYREAELAFYKALGDMRGEAASMLINAAIEFAKDPNDRVRFMNLEIAAKKHTLAQSIMTPTEALASVL